MSSITVGSAGGAYDSIRQAHVLVKGRCGFSIALFSAQDKDVSPSSFPFSYRCLKSVTWMKEAVARAKKTLAFKVPSSEPHDNSAGVQLTEDGSSAHGLPGLLLRTSINASQESHSGSRV